MHDGQWLLDEDSACLLDFDLLCLAEPELDLANFAAHLELRRFQHPDRINREDVKSCRSEWRAGAGLAVDPESKSRFRFYRASTFARLALVYQLRSRWLPLVPNLMARCERDLEWLERELPH